MDILSGATPLIVDVRQTGSRPVEAVLHTLDLGSALSSSVQLDSNAVAIVRRFVAVADNGDGLVRPEL